MLGVMETVTVFRSADPSAESDATAVLNLLKAHGIAASLIDDKAPGVPQGAYEVHVAAADQAPAEALISTHPIEDEFSNPDESSDLDMVTVFRSAGSGTESEAMVVQGLLESNGVEALLMADSRFPNLSEHVRVPRNQVTDAKRLIANALAAGSAGAEEAEAGSEN
jgi:hypothetical protein